MLPRSKAEPPALATASGQAAETLAILTLANAGDEIVSTTSLYGGTYNLFHYTLPKLGITVRFADADDFDGLRAAINAKTRAVYTETLGNPKLDIVDMEQLAAIAHEHGLPLIIDNTVATPSSPAPIEHGADIVVNSATKFIGGHGTSIGGVIVDAGKFDWKASGRFKDFVDPDPSYHGLSYVEAFGPLAFILKARVQGLRDTGAAVPLQLLPLPAGTRNPAPAHGAPLPERSRHRQAPRARTPASSGSTTPACPPASTTRARKKYCPTGQRPSSPSASRAVRSGKSFINSLKLFSHLANLGDSKSLVIHPASTTHQQLTAKSRPTPASHPNSSASPSAPKISATSSPTSTRPPADGRSVTDPRGWLRALALEPALTST